MRSDNPSALGLGSTTTAPAPSDNIHRKNSASNPGARSWEKRSERRVRLTISDPTATATSCDPRRTAASAPRSAATPEQQTPPAESTSIGPPPIRPWTIEAKPGTGKSPCVVPVASIPTSRAVRPRFWSARRTARSASSSLSIRGSPLTVHGVVALLDPVGVEHPRPQPIRDPGDVAEVTLKVVVADGLAGEVSPDAGDVCAHRLRFGQFSRPGYWGEPRFGSQGVHCASITHARQISRENREAGRDVGAIHEDEGSRIASGSARSGRSAMGEIPDVALGGLLPGLAQCTATWASLACRCWIQEAGQPRTRNGPKPSASIGDHERIRLRTGPHTCSEARCTSIGGAPCWDARNRCNGRFLA